MPQKSLMPAVFRQFLRGYLHKAVLGNVPIQPQGLFKELKESRDVLAKPLSVGLLADQNIEANRFHAIHIWNWKFPDPKNLIMAGPGHHGNFRSFHGFHPDS